MLRLFYHEGFTAYNINKKLNTKKQFPKANINPKAVPIKEPPPVVTSADD